MHPPLLGLWAPVVQRSVVCGLKSYPLETSHKQITHDKLREGPSELRTISGMDRALTDLRWVISVWNGPLKSESGPLSEMHTRRHNICYFEPVMGAIMSGVGPLSPGMGSLRSGMARLVWAIRPVTSPCVPKANVGQIFPRVGVLWAKNCHLTLARARGGVDATPL